MPSQCDVLGPSPTDYKSPISNRGDNSSLHNHHLSSLHVSVPPRLPIPSCSAGAHRVSALLQCDSLYCHPSATTEPLTARTHWPVPSFSASHSPEQLKCPRNHWSCQGRSRSRSRSHAPAYRLSARFDLCYKGKTKL